MAARVLNVMDQEMGEVVIICTMKCKCKLKCNNPHNNGGTCPRCALTEQSDDSDDITSDREDNELLPIIETQREKQ